MKPFNNIAGLHPGRSVFNRSSYKLFDCDIGQIIPIYCDNMVPGDKFKISNEIVIRATPMLAPILHEVNVYVHYFFVPKRLMWPKPQYKKRDGTPILMPHPDTSSWEDFFTGGTDGKLTPVKPKWKNANRTVGSLYDYFGFPPNVDPAGAYPDIWPLRAYNMVWNENYRIQDYQDPVDLDNDVLKYRNWQRDYFTTALPELQRGTAPALPFTFDANVNFLGQMTTFAGASNTTGVLRFGNHVEQWAAPEFGGALRDVNVPDSPPRLGVVKGDNVNSQGNFPELNAQQNKVWMDAMRAWLNNNNVNVDNMATFDVNDLRLAFATQKYLERNMRAGGRYNEQIKAHFGISPRDERLQRPEYVGGTRAPIIVSEVLQTSQTTTDPQTGSPQGTLAGHGIAVNQNRACTYFAQEHGVIIGLMSLMPRPVYQQGIDRQWLGETRYDELLPEFVNLGEQGILNAEVYAKNDDPEYNKGLFGYQARYDEYRYAQNIICGNLRSGTPAKLDHWHMARYFRNPPALNSEFLTCNDDLKRIFAVTGQPGWVVMFGNRVRAVRPLPVVGTPGLIDHN